MLWSTVMLGAIGATIVTTGRSDVQLASNLRQAAEAEAEADGAVQRAAYRLLVHERLPLDGTSLPADRDGVRVVLCMTDEGGKINPNSANAALLAGLLRAHSIDAGPAQRLADAIVLWRTPGDAAAAAASDYAAAGLRYAPPGKPFGTLQELRLVLGMTPALFQAVAPDLSIWNQGDPNFAVATPIVRAAIRSVTGFEPPAVRFDPNAPVTAAFVAEALTPGGGRFRRHAVLRVSPGQDPPVRTLAWDTGGACGPAQAFAGG